MVVDHIIEGPGSNPGAGKKFIDGICALTLNFFYYFAHLFVVVVPLLLH